MTILSVTWESPKRISASSTTGAKLSFANTFSATLKDSEGAFLFDRVFALSDYSLTTAAGNFDLDLYDLASLDIGAGAGRDNLGQAHANARIVAMAVRNQVVASGGTLRIDNNGATGPWKGIFGATRVLDLAQGAYFTTYLGESGKTVTDSSDHIMRLSAQTSNCTIDVVFLSKQS